jgi:hypothetical protein
MILVLWLSVLLQTLGSVSIAKSELKQIDATGLFEKSCGPYLVVTGTGERTQLSVSVSDPAGFRESLKKAHLASSKIHTDASSLSRVTYPATQFRFIPNPELKPGIEIQLQNDSSLLIVLSGVTFRDLSACGLLVGG